jgi:hypothetical protein
LFGQPHAFGLFASAEMVPGFAVSANQDAAVEVMIPLLTEHFERSCGRELEIVEVGMDKQDFHNYG